MSLPITLISSLLGWLEDFLINNGKAVVVISHDRKFVDNITTRTIEVTMGRIYDYKVNYSQYLQLRAERREQQMKQYEEQQKMIQKPKISSSALRVPILRPSKYRVASKCSKSLSLSK